MLCLRRRKLCGWTCSAGYLNPGAQEPAQSLSSPAFHLERNDGLLDVAEERIASEADVVGENINSSLANMGRDGFCYRCATACLALRRTGCTFWAGSHL